MEELAERAGLVPSKFEALVEAAEDAGAIPAAETPTAAASAKQPSEIPAAKEVEAVPPGATLVWRCPHDDCNGAT